MAAKHQSRISTLLKRTFLERKLDNWLGYLLVGCFATAIAYLLAFNLLVGFGLVASVLAIFVLLVCIINPQAGLYICITFIFFIYYVMRLGGLGDDFPLGLFYDILLVGTMVGVFANKEYAQTAWANFIRTPAVIWILVFFFYSLFEVINPYTHSLVGWTVEVRKEAEHLALLFIVYNVFSDYRRLVRGITVLFVLCTIAGLYGCIQQWHGLFDFERNWVMASSGRLALMFIMGNFRKFSILPDPASYGIVMGGAVVFFTLIALFQKRPVRKWLMLGGVIFMALGMFYSGTRTANVIVIAGVGMFMLLTFDKKQTRVFAFVAGFLFLLALYLPIYGNSTLNRFRSSFIGTKDESFKVRETERAAIQPYAYAHPIGGGFGSSGDAGSKNNPGQVLAGYQTDDGYLRMALESGWIGLILFCIPWFVILRTGIRRFFHTKDEKLKIIYAASIAALVAFMLAELAQEVVGQICCDVVFYPIVAIILRPGYANGSPAGTAP